MRKTALLILIFILSFALRFFELGINPPSLYWDEASLGYNAYSIATSLKDEHGRFLPLDKFIAFGDYKPPGYIYAAALSVKLMGLNEQSIRLPSFLAGLLIVIITYFLVKELFQKEKLALISMLIVGISPWAIHFSRAAYEANLAAFLNLFGIYLFIRGKRSGPLLLLSVVSFILSFYTFNANRIIAPLLLVFLGVIYFRSLWDNKKWLFFSIITGLLMVIPSLSFLNSSEGKLRFQEVSIFNNLEPVEKSNMMIRDDGSGIISKILHNRRVIFAADFMKHYTDNFSLRFLFKDGDVNPRLAVGDMGELYFLELPFLIIGILMLIKKREKSLAIILIWMFIAPIPAGTARETPHALRIISILPTFQIIIAYGIYNFANQIRTKLLNKELRITNYELREYNTANNNIHSSELLIRNSLLNIMLYVICFMLSANIFYYLHNYYAHYPAKWSGEWQYGYKEMVNYVLSNESKYDQILVTSALGRPYIYFALYRPYSNESFVKNAVVTRDAFGFYDVKAVGKIRFEWGDISQYRGRVLLVTTDKNLSSGFRLLKSVKNLSGSTVFYIGERI